MADNSSKYSTRVFGQKTTTDLINPDKDQVAVVYDLLAEGPIQGLVNDSLSSVFYNDVPLVDDANANILKPRRFTTTTTAGGTTVTASEFGTIRQLSYNNKSGTSIGKRVLTIEGAGTKGTGIASITSGSKVVSTSSSFFTTAMVDKQASTLPVFIRISGAGAGGQDLVCRIKKRISATSAELSIRALTTVSSADIVQDYVGEISSIATNTATITPATTTAVTNGECLVSGPELDENSQLTNFSNVNFGIRVGNKLQTTLMAPGFAGSSSTVHSVNQELFQADLRSVSGLSGLSSNYNSSGIDEPGNVNEGTASDTVLTAASMGVSNPEEIDEVHVTLNFPQCHAVKNSSGAKGPSFVEVQMFFEYTTDGTNFISAQAFGPTNSQILTRSGAWGNNVTYGIDGSTGVPSNGYIKPKKAQYSDFIEEFVMNVEQFQPFLNYRIRIRRITDDGFKDGSFQHFNPAFIKTVENITKDKLSYPYAAYASNVLNAKDFSGGLPSRAYRLKGKLIQVPTNYLTRDESSDGTAKYTRSVSGSAPNFTVTENSNYQSWNGSFRGDKTAWDEGHPNRELVYSNNPAWVFYDILINNRYGVGQFVDKSFIDKYSLFEIAKYCDELVSDGEGGLEPRFTCNLYLTKTAEATKVLRDIASIFRGMVLWSDGEIVPISDRPKAPVYTFTKGNVKDGAFVYEGTGDRVRTNQVKVTWNDPADNFRQAAEYVEDHQNIIKTNRIVREASVAFGCTSRAQAYRYGKWKLLSAQLEKETVSFSTGINAIGLKPGDIIAVQDADKEGFQYSGRVSNTGTKSTTVIPLDRSITLPSYSNSFPPQLLLIYPEGGCYLTQEKAVINSVTYKTGDLLLENADGSALDTQEEAANLVDDSGEKVLNFWSENVRVEKKPVSTSAGSVSSLTVSSAFSSAPNAEVIWALQLFNSDGTARTGTAKEYKIVSIAEKEDNCELDIVAAEFARAKFDAVDRGYTLYSKPTQPLPENTDVIPAPRDIVAQVSPMSAESADGGSTIDFTGSGARVTVSWSAPLNSNGTPFRDVSGFEVKHNFNGGFEFIKTNSKDRVVDFENVNIGTYEVHVRTISTIDTLSAWTVRQVEVAPEEIISLPGVSRTALVPRGGVLDTSLSINSSSGLLSFASGTYNFENMVGTQFSFTSTGNNNKQQAFSGMSNNTDAFLLFDASDTSHHLKAVEIKTDANIKGVEYFAEVGASNAGLTQASGTITVEQFSNQIDGSSTSFTSDFKSGDLVKLDNGTAAQATYARVQTIESNTLMFIDVVVERAYSSNNIFKQTFKPDLNADTIIAKINKSSGAAYSITATFAITAGLDGQDGQDGQDGADGADGAAGAVGATGAAGADGRRTATGQLYYQVESASAPSAPSGSTVQFNFSTGAMSNTSGSVIGTSGTVWNVTPPVATGGASTSKTWFVYYSVVESSAGSGVGTPTFDSTVKQATSFTGLVTFSSGNFQQNGSNITTIDGANIETGSISANKLDITLADSATETIANIRAGTLAASFTAATSISAGRIQLGSQMVFTSSTSTTVANNNIDIDAASADGPRIVISDSS